MSCRSYNSHKWNHRRDTPKRLTGETGRRHGQAAAPPEPPSGFGRYQYAGGWGYESPAGDGFPGARGGLILAGVSPTLPPITLMHVGARWYDPSLGRFLQRDPIGLRGGLNVYEYCRSRATNGVDPSGLIVRLPSPEELDRWLDGIINGRVGGAVGAACGAGLAANCKWRLGIGALVNRLSVVCAGVWIGWNAGDAIYEPVVEPLIDGLYEGPRPSSIGSYPDPSFCFAQGTEIMASDGLVPVEQLAPGDPICPDEADAALAPSRVVAVSTAHTRRIVAVLLPAEVLCCTEGHPFWVEGLGWVAAGDLAAGMALRAMDGSSVPVMDVSVSILDRPVTVYALEVSAPHKYCAGRSRVIVHNKVIHY